MPTEADLELDFHRTGREPSNLLSIYYTLQYPESTDDYVLQVTCTWSVRNLNSCQIFSGTHAYTHRPLSACAFSQRCAVAHPKAEKTRLSNHNSVVYAKSDDESS